jgi:ATP-dependent Clp protease, protease subunit
MKKNLYKDVDSEEQINILLKAIDHDMDILNRIIYLEDEIELFTASFIKQRIELISAITGDYKSPITIEMNSSGGNLYGALAVMDVISTTEPKINILGRGAVMSAAAFILISGTGNRILTQNSVVMIHEISTLLMGSSKDIITESKHLEKIQNRLFCFLGKHSNKSSDYWKTKLVTNFYLSMEECMEHGIIDKVL